MLFIIYFALPPACKHFKRKISLHVQRCSELRACFPFKMKDGADTLQQAGTRINVKQPYRHSTVQKIPPTVFLTEEQTTLHPSNHLLPLESQLVTLQCHALASYIYFSVNGIEFQRAPFFIKEMSYEK